MKTRWRPLTEDQKRCVWNLRNDLSMRSQIDRPIGARKIAKILGISYQQVERELGLVVSSRSHTRFRGSPPAKISAPMTIWEERDKRYEASLNRTFTQVFFGDPPPRYSALDKRGENKF